MLTVLLFYCVSDSVLLHHSAGQSANSIQWDMSMLPNTAFLYYHCGDCTIGGTITDWSTSPSLSPVCSPAHMRRTAGSQWSSGATGRDPSILRLSLATELGNSGKIYRHCCTCGSTDWGWRTHKVISESSRRNLSVHSIPLVSDNWVISHETIFSITCVRLWKRRQK